MRAAKNSGISSARTMSPTTSLTISPPSTGGSSGAGPSSPFSWGSAIKGVSLGSASNVVRGGGLLATAVTGGTLGAGMAVGKKMIQSDGWVIFFLALFAAAVHAIDYSFFQFAYSPIRILLYMVVAIVFAGTLYPDQDEARTQTLKAIIYSWIFFFVASNLAVKYFPTLIPQQGLLEFGIGVVFFAISLAKPGIFVKQPVLAPIFNMFLFSSFIMPFLGFGIFDRFFSTGGTYVYIFKNYASALFWPVWFWFVLFFTHYKSLPMRIISVLCLVLFLTPAWYVSYQTQVIGADGSGVTQQQKSVYFQYWSIVQDSTISLGRASMSLYNTSWTKTACWYYGFQQQLGSTTGGTAGVSQLPAYCLAGANGANTTIDGFDTSVESGSTSPAGLTLDPIISTQLKFYSQQDMTFLSLVKAHSFDTQVSVNTSCFAQILGSTTDAPHLGTITNPNFLFTGSANKDLTCKIPQGSLDDGKSYQLTIAADFNYATSAYLRTYFTKAGLLSQFASRTSTPQAGFFSFYQISDNNPQSLSTKGPAIVGINVANPVIELADQSTGQATQFTVRLLIKNVVTWNGKVKYLTGLVFSLPNGLQIVNGIPKVKPKNFPDYATWSDLSCTVSGLVANFKPLSADDCAAINADPSSPFQDLNCNEYNNYILTPTSDSSLSAFSIEAGQEKNQQVYLTCDVAATNPSQVLGNAPYSVKSIRATAAYDYTITQTKAFKTEAAQATGSNTIYADPYLNARNFCNTQGSSPTPNSYALTPVLEDVFAGPTVDQNNALRQEYDSMISTISQTLISSPSSTAQQGAATITATTPDGGLLTGSDCFTKSIAQAIILNNWDQVVGNPMVTGSFYGYLQAKRSMIQYINVSTNKVDPNLGVGGSGSGAASGSYDTAATLLLNSQDFDNFMRANNIVVGMSYLNQLRADCAKASSGKDNMVCVIGKYMCGTQYTVGDLSTFCGQKTVPTVMTLATQIAQIEQPINPAAAAAAASGSATSAASGAASGAQSSGAS